MFLPRIFTQVSLQSRTVSTMYSPETVLSIENKQKTVAKFLNMKPIRLQPHKPAKKAAVLIPLCLVDNKVSLLYTLRGSKLKKHGRQVSFPGGMQDSTDSSLEETALRETWEELGICPQDVELWGSGNQIVSRGETCVTPVVGQLKKKLVLSDLKLNPNEVSEAFTVSLEDLCHPTNLMYTQFKDAYSIPVFTGGKMRVWGLTGMITHLFLQSLLPTRGYTHRIKYIPPVNSKMYQI